MKKKLEEWENQYDALEVRDHELDQAIEAGMQKAVKQQFWKGGGLLQL